jgi:hypothetical protein
VSFAAVAWAAGGLEVGRVVGASLISREDVIDGRRGALAARQAELAGVLVAHKDGRSDSGPGACEPSLGGGGAVGGASLFGGLSAGWAALSCGDECAVGGAGSWRHGCVPSKGRS